MRNIGDQAALRGHQRFDLLCHMIEIATKLRDLILFSGDRIAHARVEAALGQLLSGHAELADGFSDRTREPKAYETRDQNHNDTARDLHEQRSLQNTGARGTCDSANK